MAVTSDRPVDVEPEIELDREREARSLTGVAAGPKAPWTLPGFRLGLPQDHLDWLTEEGRIPAEPPAVLMGEVRRQDLQRARDVAIDRESRRVEEKGGWEWRQFEGSHPQVAPPLRSGISTTESMKAGPKPGRCMRCGLTGLLVVRSDGRLRHLRCADEVVAKAGSVRRLHRRKPIEQLSPKRTKWKAARLAEAEADREAP